MLDGVALLSRLFESMERAFGSALGKEFYIFVILRV
jgi:hypothetical protein